MINSFIEFTVFALGFQFDGRACVDGYDAIMSNGVCILSLVQWVQGGWHLNLAADGLASAGAAHEVLTTLETSVSEALRWLSEG